MPPVYEGSKRVIARYIGSAPVSSVMIGDKSCFAGALPSIGCTFLAKLISSLVPEVGTGGPTWSRATKAWGFNELGYLGELASGCASFGGARLVRNLVSSAEDVSTAGWTKANVTTPSAGTVVCSASTVLQQIYGGNKNYVAGEKYLIKARMSYIDHPYVQIHISSGVSTAGANFDIQNGAYQTIAGASASISLVSPGVYDCSVWITITSTATFMISPKINFVSGLGAAVNATFAGDGIKSYGITRIQMNDVTNYDASYIPEYVSVGVLSAPYHGAGADGCKYFATDWQGAPIAAANLLKLRREASAINNLLYSRDLTNQAISMSAKRWEITGTSGAELVTNGTFDADLANWTPAIGSGGSISATGGICTFVSDGGTYTGITNSATITAGKTYVCTVICTGTGSIKFQSTLEVAGISSGTNTFNFVANGTAIILARTVGVACNLAIDSISIKEAAVQCTRATGLDGIANTATTLTATAADAIILQPISLASAARCASAYVKRRTGTGTISFTQDGGSTWTDITSQINSSTWSRVQITSTLANPSVGFKISTSGDAIDVDCVQNEAGAVATSPIVTTTTTVSRNGDSDTYQTASNWSDTAGTAYIEAQPWQWSSGGLLGSATNGLLESASNSGATAYDGTNAANGPTGTPSGRKKLALRWTGATMDVSVNGVIGTAGTYDGAMGLASLGIAVNSSGYFGPSAVWNYAMTDDEFKALTT